MSQTVQAVGGGARGWRAPSRETTAPPVAIRCFQAVTPGRVPRMMASIRSFAINFSFFSSLIRQC